MLSGPDRFDQSAGLSWRVKRYSAYGMTLLNNPLIRTKTRDELLLRPMPNFGVISI